MHFTSMFVFRRVALLLLVGLAESSVAQQATNCTPASVPLVVFDGSGNMVKGLGSQHLRARASGHATSIDSVVQHSGPVRVVLVIDQGLVGSREKWPAVHQLANDLIRFARSDTLVALEAFGHGFEQQVPFGQSRESLLTKIDALSSEPHHSGAILEGIRHALSLFGPPQLGDTLYVMTDGVDQESHASQAAIKEASVSSGVRVFAVYFREQPVGPGAAVVVSGNLPGVLPSQRFDPNYDPIDLVDLVEQTGGLSASIVPKAGSQRYELQGNRLQALQGDAALHYRAMTQFYLLTLKGNYSAGQQLQIEFSDSRFSSLHLAYPRKLTSCAAAQP